MAAHFNPAPGWEPPPSPDWRPPTGWEPPAEWPPAPPGWGFWVDDDGQAVPGPYGLYGAENSRAHHRRIAGLLALPVAVIACLALAVQSSGGSNQASPATSTRSATVTATTTVTATQRETATRTATVTQTVTSTVSASQAAAPDPAPVPVPAPAPVPAPVPAPGEVYYANCDAVRAANAAPLYRGQPGYRPALDRDGDGIACERRHR